MNRFPVLAALVCGTLSMAALPAQKAAGTPKRKAARAMRLIPAGAGKTLSQEELKAKFEAKIAQPWAKNAAWILDFDKAQAAARESGKPIFGYFTRSYAP